MKESGRQNLNKWGTKITKDAWGNFGEVKRREGKLGE